MAYETLEEAQQRIIELTEDIQNLRLERYTLSQDNENLTNEVEELRALNQKYFNKLIAQETPEKHDDEEQEDVPTCEEFAASLNF